MTNFHTLKETVSITGASLSTIKRLQSKILAEDDHPDRHLLTPSAEDYIAFKDSDQPFKWKISEDLLRRQFPDAFQPSPSKEGTARSESTDNSESISSQAIAVLESQLKAKNEQIARLFDQLTKHDQLIDKLGTMTNRMHESLLAPPIQQPTNSVNSAGKNRDYREAANSTNTRAANKTIDAEIRTASGTESQPRNGSNGGSLADRYLPTFKKFFSAS